MSVEVITMLGVGASILLAGGSACGWMIHRMDKISDRLETNLGSRIERVQTELGSRIERVETNLGSRIDRVETELGSRIERVKTELGVRIERVQTELVEVKIAVARIEGPPRHLVTAR
jgi:phage baseplate assembly protein W